MVTKYNHCGEYLLVYGSIMVTCQYKIHPKVSAMKYLDVNSRGLSWRERKTPKRCSVMSHYSLFNHVLRMICCIKDEFDTPQLFQFFWSLKRLEIYCGEKRNDCFLDVDWIFVVSIRARIAKKDWTALLCALLCLVFLPEHLCIIVCLFFTTIDRVKHTTERSNFCMGCNLKN